MVCMAFISSSQSPDSDLIPASIAITTEELAHIRYV